MYVGLAEMEESYFADKTSIFVALGPVTKIPNQSSDLLSFITFAYDVVADTAWLFGIYDIFSANWFTTTACDLLCGAIP